MEGLLWAQKLPSWLCPPESFRLLYPFSFQTKRDHLVCANPSDAWVHHEPGAEFEEYRKKEPNQCIDGGTGTSARRTALGTSGATSFMGLNPTSH